MVTAPGLSAVTLPKRSTVATDASDDDQVGDNAPRLEPSVCTPVALFASAVPTYSLPGSAEIAMLLRSGHVTSTGMANDTLGSPGAPAALAVRLNDPARNAVATPLLYATSVRAPPTRTTASVITFPALS